jgi:hypothetical protein
MRAVLLFSAALHISALGLVVAYALRHWIETRRPKEPSLNENVTAAFTLGGVITVATTLLMWFARDFGAALLAGLAAGALAGVAFLLYLGASPGERPAHGGEGLFPMERRMTTIALVGVLALSELAAFCFLISAAGALPPHS